jgi:TPR repeat protein
MTAPPLEGVRPVPAATPPAAIPGKPRPLLWSIGGAAIAAMLIGVLLHFSRTVEEPPKPQAIADVEPSKALQDKIAALEKQVAEDRRRRDEAERRQREEAEAAERRRAEDAKREAEERARAAARRAEDAKREAEERARAAAARRAEEEASRRAEAVRAAKTPAAARVKPEPAPAPVEPAKPPPQTAGQLLAQADDAAARGNFGDAAALLKPLADRGDTAALFRLSQLYLEGRGVGQDQKEGLRLLEGAATQGHRDARLLLGGMYAAGRGGVRQNANVAYIWYGAAACAGAPRAQAEQETMKARLQPAEVQQADKLIADLCRRG